jgi:hypothetical protein
MESAEVPSTGEQIKKMWFTHTMEFHSAIRMNYVIYRKMARVGDYHVK